MNRSTSMMRDTLKQLQLARPHHWLSIIITCASLAWSAPQPVHAQNEGRLGDQSTSEPAPTDDDIHIITAEQIQQQIDALEGRTDLTEEEKAAIKALLDETLTLVQRASTATERAAQFETDRLAAPGRVEELKSRIAALKQIEQDTVDTFPLETTDGSPVDTLTIAQVRTYVTDAESTLISAQGSRNSIDDEQTRRESQRQLLPEQISLKSTELTQVENEIAQLARGDGEWPAMFEARSLRARAQQAALQAEIEESRRELLSYEQRAELINLRFDEAVLQAVLAERRHQAWQKYLSARQVREAAQQEEEARQQVLDLASEHPIVIEAANENRRIAARHTELQAKLTRTKTETDAVKAESTKHQSDLETIQEQDTRYASGSYGILLQRMRAELPSTRDHERRLEEIEKQIAELRNEEIETESERASLQLLADREARVTKLIANADPPVPADHLDATRTHLLGLLENRADLLRQLKTSIDQDLAKKADLVFAHTTLIETVRTYAEFVDERIFWVRSAPPISWRDYLDLGKALQWITSAPAWSNVGTSLVDDLRANPFLYALAFLVITTALISTPRLTTELTRLGDDVGRVRTDRYASSMRALLLTLLLTVIWPPIPGFLGWRLVEASGTSDFAQNVANGLLNAAYLLVIVRFIMIMSRPGGLAEAHFRERRSTLSRLRRHMRWLAIIIVPMAFMVGTLEDASDQSHFNHLGRLCFLIAIVALFFAGRAVLRPDSGIFSEYLRRHESGWFNRLRYLWYAMLLALPIALSVLASLGFFYTAVQLERRLVATVLIAMVLWILHSLAMRWLVLVQKRVAIERAEAKREAAQTKVAAAVSSAPVPGEPTRAADEEASVATHSPTPPAESEGQYEIDLAQVSVQSRSMLRFASAIAFAIALFLVWRDTLPAFTAFDRIILFGHDTDNKISLGRVIVAVLMAFFTFQAGRNLPGIIEISILNQLPIEPSSRYAFKALTRYLITITGVLIAFGIVGIGWSDVQWLVAAITVGLGFGLQEIFANFVSGLIILFERPIRVGDTVTVGNVSGTVTRIQMRATTITDWDRKELIVPNREFITGQLVNWTLSDPILRIRLPVGIAYGSDTNKATEVLQRVAQEDPVVLNDPPPLVIFNGFGDSTLDFELRVFIPSIEHFLKLRHHLNMQIEHAFREAGIEIAFPQRDIHVRSINGPFKIEQTIPTPPRPPQDEENDDVQSDGKSS